MTERERILEEMEEEIKQRFLEMKLDDSYTDSAVYAFARAAAEVALALIEKPLDSSHESYPRICNCGHNGYAEGTPHSNHPHRKECPQYAGDQ